MILSRRETLKTSIASMAALCLSGAPAQSQAWPSKPIKIVCAFLVGGLADLFARAYGEYLSQKLGQPVVVENRAGASGSIAAQAVTAAPPDGHTLLVAITATLAQNRVLYSNLPYDPDKDFALISYMPSGHLPFIAAKMTKASNLEEFITYARKNPTNVGTWGAGSYGHIVVAELNKQFGLQVNPVHYRGEAPMWQDLAAGELHAATGTFPNATNAMLSGAGQAVAVPLTRRNSKLPDVPTFIEQGLNSQVFSLVPYVCLVGPANIPQEIVERLSALMVEAGRSERVQKLLETFGIDQSAQGHVAFRALYDKETPNWVDAVRDLGLTPQ